MSCMAVSIHVSLSAVIGGMLCKSDKPSIIIIIIIHLDLDTWVIPGQANLRIHVLGEGKGEAH